MYGCLPPLLWRRIPVNKGEVVMFCLRDDTVTDDEAADKAERYEGASAKEMGLRRAEVEHMASSFCKEELL